MWLPTVADVTSDPGFLRQCLNVTNVSPRDILCRRIKTIRDVCSWSGGEVHDLVMPPDTFNSNAEYNPGILKPKTPILFSCFLVVVSFTDDWRLSPGVIRNNLYDYVDKVVNQCELIQSNTWISEELTMTSTFGPRDKREIMLNI